MEGIQYGGGISSIRWKIFGTDVSHHQYGGDTSSVQWRACSIDLSHHQYRGGCAVHGYTNTAQGVVGGCINLGKLYFTYNLTQISSYCDESRCS